MTNDRPILDDLKGLRRGRGVRRPQPDRWIGPQLRQALETVTGAREPEALRDALVAEVRGAVQDLPRDLAGLYLAACGITRGEAFLKDRLELLTDLLDRHPRTLQRRLGEADQLVAAAFERRLAIHHGENEVMRRGWSLQEFKSHLRLDLPQPEYRVTRTIQVTAARITSVSDVFSMPEPAGPDELLEAAAAGGCSLRELEQLAPSLWRVHLDLPHPLTRGDTWTLGNIIRVSSLKQIPTYLVIAPARLCAAFTVRVDVGGSGATDFTQLTGVPLVVLSDPDYRGQPVELEDGVVRYRAEGLQPGLAYGVRWRWCW